MSASQNGLPSLSGVPTHALERELVRIASRERTARASARHRNRRRDAIIAELRARGVRGTR